MHTCKHRQQQLTATTPALLCGAYTNPPLQLIAASEDFICYVIKNNIRVIHSATGGRALLKLEPAGTKPQDMHMYSSRGGLSLLACVTTAGDLIIWRLFNMGLEGGR
jgi:hypothetical protein